MSVKQALEYHQLACYAWPNYVTSSINVHVAGYGQNMTKS